MLSRHFLRSKVLQEIYASQMEGKDAIQACKDFEYHIGRLNELGVLQVSLMTKVFEIAEVVKTQRRLPTVSSSATSFCAVWQTTMS